MGGAKRGKTFKMQVLNAVAKTYFSQEKINHPQKDVSKDACCCSSSVSDLNTINNATIPDCAEYGKQNSAEYKTNHAPFLSKTRNKEYHVPWAS